MSAKTIEAGRIAGALKCMDALRKLARDAERSIENERADRTVEEYFGQRLSDVRALVAALGPMSPEQEGALATLAEYIHSEICGSTPDVSLGYWLPLAAMTDAEQKEMTECMEAENAEIDAQYNVISLDERRAAR